MKKVTANLKTFITSSLLLISYSSSAQWLPSFPPAERFDIKFYIHKAGDGGGYFTQIPAHTGGNGDHGSPALVAYVGSQANDRISSIGFHPNSDQCLLVYEHDNFLGVNHVIGENVANLNDYPYRFNDKISSYIMFKPSPYSGFHPNSPVTRSNSTCAASVATLFENTNVAAGGNIYHLPFGQIMHRLGFINDRISKVFVPISGCLKVWVDSPPNNSANYSNWYNNPSMTFTEGTFNLSSYGLNNQISAVELKSCY